MIEICAVKVTKRRTELTISEHRYPLELIGVMTTKREPPATRAELEELREANDDYSGPFIEVREAAYGRALRERDELRDANERLRAALQEIIDHPAPSRVATVAREALDRDD